MRSRGIRFDTEGKNIGEGWIGMSCLWCSDKSNHLGINLSSKVFSCWKCHRKGPSTLIVQILDKCGENRAKQIMEEFVDLSSPLSRVKEPSGKEGEILPKYATQDFPDIHIDYLKSRNFIPEIVIPKYQLHACYNAGDYKFRIIIPVIINQRIVSFVARDVTNEARDRYLSAPIEAGLLLPEEFVYNIDTVGRKALIVEGAPDVWRMGDGTVAFLGTEFSNAQFIRLKRAGVKSAALLYDAEPEAMEQAEKICINLDAIGIKSDVYLLPEGDPAELSQKEADYVKKEIM